MPNGREVRVFRCKEKGHTAALAEHCTGKAHQTCCYSGWDNEANRLAHTLCHSFGTLLKENGADLKLIQSLMRHSNVSVNR